MVLISETSLVRLTVIGLVQQTELMRETSSDYLSVESKATKMVLMMGMNWVLRMV